MINRYQPGFLISLLIVLTMAAGLYAQDTTVFSPKKAEYLWPTNASNALSGVFSETRSRHFHAALDIKTWGQRGYPVYATRAGKLHRIAIGPTGYGKVLYLKHYDGSYSLYAHLLRFNDQLRNWSDSLRLDRNINGFDMVVDSLDIRFEQGDQIALSGASGIGPPHLHFELRTPDEEPFNPLLTNLKIQDTISPTFSGLAVLPLSINTKIEGSNRIYTRKPSRRSVYADFGTVSASGPLGLAIDLFDQANGVSNVYAVYEISMEVDGERVFLSRVDQFSYDETDQMHIDRVYPLLQSTGRGFQRLYVSDGNTLSFYDTSGNGGRLHLSPGEHTIVIEAKDFYGNSRQAQLKLDIAPSGSSGMHDQPYLAGTSDEPVTPNEWTWFNNWVNIPVDQFQQLTLAPLLSSPINPLYFRNGESVSVDLSQSPQFFFRTSASDHLISRRVEPKNSAYLVTPDDSAYATFQPRTFYDTTSVAITKNRASADSIELRLIPDNQPIARSFEMRVQLDSLQQKDTTLSFYRTYAGSEYLRKLKSEVKDDYLTASASTLGRYLILSDTTAPSIRKPRIIRSPDDFWLVYISAWDRRSGIDYERSRIYVNGVRGITEYEPEDGRLVYYHPSFTPRERNDIRIVAYDKAGNREIVETTVSR